MKRFLRLFLPVLLLLCLVGCSSVQTDIPPTPAVYPPINAVRLDLVAAGDNLIHGPIYRQAREQDGQGGFDFTAAYQPVADLIAGADLAYVTQETPLGGTELGLKSYPMFNSPQEVGLHLINMGFNMVSHANNHVLDAASRGFERTIEFWRAQENVIMAGIAADAADDQIRILECNGLKIALLAYTYGTNGLSLPASHPGIVKLINDELMLNELAEANELADIVLVGIHWGMEYQKEPNDEQQRLANLLAEGGADIIIGSHPHVLQTAELLTTTDNRSVPVFYSLGNFISAQDRPDTMLGGLARLQMTYLVDTDHLLIDEMTVIPVVNDYTGNYENITVYPLADYTNEQAANHGIRGKYPSFSREYLEELYNDRIPAEYRTE